MLGLILFLLLLPVLLHLLAKVFYEEDNTKVVFFKYWMYKNTYHLGMLLGVLSRFIIPGNKPETDTPSEDLSIEKEIVRGVKEAWKS